MGLVARKTTVLLGGAAMAIAAGAFHAAAQEAAGEGETVLESIEVKGKKAAAGSVAETPTATQTTAEDIRERQITNIQDLSNTTEPGVNYSAATKSINIRGLEDDRILTTIDGIRIPFMPDYARSAFGGVDTFDFSSLATVDIVRGGDSSRGGSGMLGGAVVLRTLEPEDLIIGDREWGAFLQSTFDSRDRSVLGSAAFARRFGDTSVLMQASYRRGHEIETNGSVGGNGLARSKANPVDYNQSNLLFKLRHNLEGGHTVGFSAERFSFDSDTALATTYGRDYAVGRNLGINDTRRERVSLDYRYESPGDGWFDNAQATLYWQRLTRKDGNRGFRLSAPVDDFMQLSDNRNTSIGFTGSAEKSFATGSFQHLVTVGVDLSSTRTTQYTFGETSCSITWVSTCNFYHLNQADMPDVDGKKAGMFIDDRIAFGDTGFSLTPGLRFDWYDYTPKPSAAWAGNSGFTALPPGQSASRVSPKLRAAYEINPSVEVYAQWAMGFRAPNVSELYHHYAKTSGIPTYEILGNPNLRPETSHGFEAGVNVGDETFGGHIGVFHNRYKDFIDTVTLTPPRTGYMTSLQSVNIDRVEISGLEVSAHKRFDSGVHVRGALAYARGKNLATGLLLDSVAPLKLVLGVGYTAEHWGIDLSTIQVARVPANSQAVFKAPGYGIVNLSGWWQPEQVEGLRIAAGVYNLFDKTHYDALAHRTVNMASTTSQPMAFYSQPGRTFKLSVTKQF